MAENPKASSDTELSDGETMICKLDSKAIICASGDNSDSINKPDDSIKAKGISPVHNILIPHIQETTEGSTSKDLDSENADFINPITEDSKKVEKSYVISQDHGHSSESQISENYFPPIEHHTVIAKFILESFEECLPCIEKKTSESYLITESLALEENDNLSNKKDISLIESEIDTKSNLSGPSKKIKLSNELLETFEGYFSEDQETVSPKKEKQKQEIEKKCSEKSKKPRKVPPNYFIALRIYNEKIHEAVKHVQEEIIRQNKMFKEMMISLPTLHLTLLVLRLNSKEDINRAHIALFHAAGQLQEEFDWPLSIKFKGISQFGKQVLFAEIVEPMDKVKRIADIMVNCFTQMNLDMPDQRPFNPHLTIMKVPHSHQYSRRISKIEENLYKEFKNMEFGNEDVTRLLLCAMDVTKNPDGFYYCSKELALTESSKLLPIKDQHTSLHKPKIITPEISLTNHFLNQQQELLKTVKEIRDLNKKYMLAKLKLKTGISPAEVLEEFQSDEAT